MERRNFITGMLLAPFGFVAAKCCCGNEIEELKDFVPPIQTEITFYGLFTEEGMKDIYSIKLGDAVYLEPNGCCTFDSQYRRFGKVKQIDDDGILVSRLITHPACHPVVQENWIPDIGEYRGAKGWDTRGYVPSIFGDK